MLSIVFMFSLRAVEAKTGNESVMIPVSSYLDLILSHILILPFSLTELTDYLFDLIYDRNYRIKNLCTATLDVIAEDHPELAEKIKQEKFSSYNAKWLNVIHSDRSSDEQFNQSALEDMFLYPDLFLKMDVLNDSSSDNLSEIEP